MSDLRLFLQHLRQPEYLHVLLNPLPLYGMAAGSFMLFVSVLRGSAKERVGAHLWILIVSAATWVAILYGEKGYDRVLAMSTSPDAQLWLKVHAARAGRFEFVFYLTGGASLLALISQKRWARFSGRMTYLTLFLSLVSMALAAWISQAGGQVRHSEFREGPPSAHELTPLGENAR